METKFGDMCANTEISCNNIESKINYGETLQPSRWKPDYWNNLGSSRNRRRKPKIIESTLEPRKPTSAFVFTDGSCRENPGPCDAEVCLLLPVSQEFTEIKQTVSKLAPIFRGNYISFDFPWKKKYKKQTLLFSSIHYFQTANLL